VEQGGLSANVRFVGYLDRDGPLLDCFKAANVFIFASRTETQGLVVLEALALGVPVVSTAVMGTKTVLDGAHGAIVVEEDEALFADAVASVLTGRQLQISLAALAAEFVRTRWSSAEMAQRMHELYQRVASYVPIVASEVQSANLD
jgi:1,2-diacylglycerol 3-alpha-glucosyltransferase